MFHKLRDGWETEEPSWTVVVVAALLIGCGLGLITLAISDLIGTR